jgi:hypothetical protein
VEIRLTPEVPPRVQTLSLTPVPDPSPELRAVAGPVAAALGEDCPRWPAGVATSPALDRAVVRRTLLAGAAWAGACTVGEVTACDGATTATFRLHGVHADLLLAVGLDRDEAGGPRVSSLALLPAP